MFYYHFDISAGRLLIPGGIIFPATSVSVHNICLLLKFTVPNKMKNKIR